MADENRLPRFAVLINADNTSPRIAAGLFELQGPVGIASVGKAARDEAVAARLWTVPEELAGVSFPQS